MGHIINFDREAGKAGLVKKKEHAAIPNLIAKLRQSVESAQQAYRSTQLLNRGYCGAGLKREIQQSQSLPQHLENAGLIMQRIIMEFELGGQQ